MRVRRSRLWVVSMTLIIALFPATQHNWGPSYFDRLIRFFTLLSSLDNNAVSLPISVAVAVVSSLVLKFRDGESLSFLVVPAVAFRGRFHLLALRFPWLRFQRVYTSSLESPSSLVSTSVDSVFLSSSLSLGTGCLIEFVVLL